MYTNNNHRVTMKDIAEKTGVSINTVSYALRGIRVAEETQAKILAAADELGYFGNSIASSMRLGVTQTVAIVQSDISNPYFSRMVRAFVNYFNMHEYTAHIYNTENDPKREQDAIISALRQNVAGLLICPEEHHFDEDYPMLQRSGTPFVVFTTDVNNPTISTVRIDEVKGGYIATEYLLQEGCRNIIMVSGPGNVMSARYRLEGYRQALNAYGLPFRTVNVIYSPSLFASVKSHNEEWNAIFSRLANNEEFDGIVAFSDQVALRVLQGLREHGFSRIPLDKIPIVGFDNIMENFPLPYPLSSVSYAEEDMAVVAPRLLLQMIHEGDEYIPQKIVLDVKVNKRK